MDAPGVQVSNLVEAGGTVASRITRAEIDTQITTAKAYPRSITKFKRDTLELACIDQQTARSMFYSIPRAGKQIVGPSIRMAEIAMATWGNLRVEGRLVDYDQKTQVVTVEAACWDLEKNTAVKVPKTRKVHGKKVNGIPQKPDADMINLASMAAMSVALRDAVFRIVPRAYINAAFEQAKVVALGKGKSVGEMREERLETAKKLGITKEQVVAACDVAGVDDIGPDEIIYIDGLLNAIRDDGISAKDAFGVEDAPVNTTGKVKDAIKKPATSEPKKEADPEPEKQPEKVEPETVVDMPGEQPEWVEQRKGMYDSVTAVDRMRLPMTELNAEYHKAKEDDKAWWSLLIDDAADHLIGLCKKVSMVPLAMKLISESLKGYPGLDEILAAAKKKQDELQEAK